jgi:hypothetical protein
MEVNKVSILLGYDTMSTGKRFQNQLPSDTVLYPEVWKSQLHGCKTLKLCIFEVWK